MNTHDLDELIVRTARELPTLPVPRNFVLPAHTAKPQRTLLGWRWVWRCASAVCVVLAVLLAGWLLSVRLSVRSSTAAMFTPAPMQAQAPAPRDWSRTAVSSWLPVLPTAQTATLPTQVATPFPVKKQTAS